MTLLQDIIMFNGQDSSKSIETAANILIESHICLVEAKSGCLILALIHKTLQAGKCWDELKGILRFKLCNANIHTYTVHFMEIQQKDNEILAAYVHHFKTAAKQCTFNNGHLHFC